MISSTDNAPIRIPNRIVYWIITPVVGVGILFAILFIRYTTPTLAKQITDQIDSNLKLASELGLEACEDRFNYLIELRLENDLAMNAALKREALEEITATSSAFRNIHALVIEDNHTIVESSQPLKQKTIAAFDLPRRTETVVSYRLLDRPVRMHYRFFPFWNWQIITYIEQKDYLGPVQLVERSIYFGTFGVLLLLTITLTVVFRKFVALPLKHLVAGTHAVAEGHYQTLPERGNDEIGQLIYDFNQMIDSLSAKDDELKHMLQEVRQTEERFRTLFESAPIGFGLIETTGRILEANDAMYHLLGFGDDQTLTSLNFYDVFHRRDDVGIFGDKLAQTHALSKIECDLVRPDGQRWTARLTASSFSLAGESLMLIIAEDASRELKLEAQLQRAQKMEAIGTLAGGVAHDLNNILAATVGYPEMLLMDLPEDSPLREPLTAIKHSGQKAAVIVQDLLTMARRGISVSEVININTIVDEYQNGSEYKRLEKSHPDIQLDVRLNKGLFNISGSVVHLSKTLMNLVSNAAEAMPVGGTIRITTENRYVDYPIGNYDAVPEGDYAVLQVSDQGTGIAKSDLDRIFEPFFSRKKMGESGTGLGMAVVYGTVKDHQGFIDVYSEVGRGTTFTLYFPITRERAEEVVPLQSLDNLKGCGETVLVVDDMAAQRQIVADMLKRLGYRAVAVASGEEAFACVKKAPPDLLLLDMIMNPGIDGLETYRRIGQVNPGQKGIITSGFSETKRVREAEALGIGKYLKKPFTIRELGESLKVLLADSR
jgi:two-component system, cell cycle sensor histidine kinase and response regulator CckA